MTRRTKVGRVKHNLQLEGPSACTLEIQSAGRDLPLSIAVKAPTVVSL